MATYYDEKYANDDEDTYFYEWKCNIILIDYNVIIPNENARFLSTFGTVCNGGGSTFVLRCKNIVQFEYDEHLYTAEIGINDKTGLIHDFDNKEVRQLVELYSNCRDIRYFQTRYEGEQKQQCHTWNLVIHDIQNRVTPNELKHIVDQFDDFTMHWNKYKQTKYIPPKDSDHQNYYFIRSDLANQIIHYAFPMRHTCAQLIQRLTPPHSH